MRVGLNIVPVRAVALAEAGRQAEEVGFDSLWLGEHLFMPVSLQSEYLSGPGRQPFDPDTPMLDPLLVLSHIGAVTTRVRLGVGIYLVPLRHPILTAKLVATLDALTGGRLDFGFGSGWMKEEFDVLGVDFSRRGALLDESLEVMRALFSDPRPAVETAHFSVPPMGFEPKLTASRLLGGGYSPVAWRRAARTAGWYGRLDRLHPRTNLEGGWDLDAVAAFTRKMRERVSEAGGDGEAFVVTGALSRAADRGELEELAGTGLDEVVVNPFPKVDGRHVGVTESTDPIHAYAEAIGLG